MQFDDCRLCQEYQRQKNVIFESDNFFVTPSIGQIVEGYLLICPKECFIAIGQLSQKLFTELEQVQTKVKNVLSEYYTEPIFFEHGSVALKGGSHIEHAHLHAVPVDIDILDDLSKNFKIRKIKNFFALNKQFKKDMPYFYYENQGGDRYLVELFEPAPSQYLRKLIAVKINEKDKWNWMWYPGLKEFNRTIKKLKGKF